MSNPNESAKSDTQEFQKRLDDYEQVANSHSEDDFNYSSTSQGDLETELETSLRNNPEGMARLQEALARSDQGLPRRAQRPE